MTDPRMKFFENLTHDEQIAAVIRMHNEGSSEFALAQCTKWSVEYIRRVLGEHSVTAQRVSA